MQYTEERPDGFARASKGFGYAGLFIWDFFSGYVLHAFLGVIALLLGWIGWWRTDPGTEGRKLVWKGVAAGVFCILTAVLLFFLVFLRNTGTGPHE
jgi:hypothetical protein